MDQNSYQPAPLPDSNYLDQISTAPKQQTVKPWILWTIIGGVLLIVIVAVFALASGGDSYTKRLQQFGWRLQSVSQLAEQSGDKIKSSDLRALNSSLIAILSGANRDVTGLTTTSGKEVAEPPKNSPILSEFAEVNSTLEDAQLNAKFDEAYARQMAYQLATLQNEITSLSKTKKSNVRSVLVTTDDNLEPLTKQFSEYKDSQS